MTDSTDSPKFWEQWKIPWTHAQCKQRYVQGRDRIGLRKLAKDSGVSFSTVGRWCAQGKWETLRRQYEDELETRANEKALELTSDKLAEELSDVRKANYEALKIARDYSSSVMQLRKRSLDEALRSNPSSEEIEAILKKHNAHEANFWSLVQARTVEAIANALGLNYFTNINTAAKVLEAKGFIILDPTKKEEESSDDTEDDDIDESIEESE